jgi:hypothetical protein
LHKTGKQGWYVQASKQGWLTATYTLPQLLNFHMPLQSPLLDFSTALRVLTLQLPTHDTIKADSHIPCRSAKGLDCVFPIWFTQCGCVWFTHTMSFPCRYRMCESNMATLLK